MESHHESHEEDVWFDMFWCFPWKIHLILFALFVVDLFGFPACHIYAIAQAARDRRG